MSEQFNLDQCTAECRQRFTNESKEARAQAHREWHEARDSFAARELDFPFRRWYDCASINEVELWHAERDANWKRIRRYQNMLVVPFGFGWLSRWLNGFITHAIQGRQAKRDSERVATIQKSH
jgi:hypothetical protein